MCKVKKLLKQFITCTLAVVILLTPMTAYSIDNDYIHGEFKIERYWSKVKSTNVGDGNEFSGIIKCIEDEENGCFYVYFSFFDYNLRPNSGDNITLSFNVTNQNKKYYFCIDKFGFTSKSDKNIEDYFEISYLFDESSSAQYSGNVYIGFEFKNKTDKSLMNYISCQYYCGDYTRHTLFTDKKLDMSSSEADNETTKSSDTEKATTPNNNGKSSSENDNVQETTKFSGSGTINNNNSDNNSDKFSIENNLSSGNQGNNADNAEKYDPSAQNELNDDLENQTVFNYSSERTNSVRIMIIVGAIIIACGVICIFLGIILHFRNQPNKKSDEKDMT